MANRIIYDTEFIDDGVTITPLSIAMRRSDGDSLYCVSDDLSAMARAAEHTWLRENVLRWLPVEVTWLGLTPGGLGVHVGWHEDHPDYVAVHPIETIRDMVEDFVLAKADPQLWAYYSAYDLVLLAQLFGPMAELPDGFPMFTLDLKHEAEMRNGVRLPELPQELVDSDYDGVRKEHYAPYDAHEEEWRLDWLIGPASASARERSRSKIPGEMAKLRTDI